MSPILGEQGIIMKKLLLAASALAAAMPAQAALVSIGFDDAQAGYTPQAASARQEVVSQFSSLGVVFADQSSPGRGVTIGKCGPGNGPLSLFGYGADFDFCGDTTPNFDIKFVDPNNAAAGGYTTYVSLMNFDGLIKLTAYDAGGNQLGSVQAFSGNLVLSGIGNISRVNVLSLDQDPTTLDDLAFEAVQAIAPGVPEPATWAMMIGGFGFVGAAARRRVRSAVSFA